MKKVITLCILCCVLSINAQISPVLLNQNIADYEIFPQSIVYYNGEIYISDFFENRIIKTSATTNDAPVIEVVTNLNFPRGLQLIGDELYFLQISTTANPSNDSGKLSKIDLTQSSPSVIDVFSGLNIPNALTGDSNTLYISEIIGDFVSDDIDGLEIQSTSISKIDLIGTPAKTVLFQNRGFVADMKLNGSDLYWFEEFEDTDRIMKTQIDNENPTAEEYYSTGDDFPDRMIINNNFLFYTSIESEGDNEFGVIKTIDLNQTQVEARIISNSFSYNAGDLYLGALVINGNDLFVSASSYNSNTDEESELLYQLDISTLSVDEINQPNLTIQFYPNPAVSEVHFNREIGELKIFDIGGKQVTSFNKKSTSFDISSLQEGVYLIKGKTDKNIYFYKKLIKK